MLCVAGQNPFGPYLDQLVRDRRVKNRKAVLRLVAYPADVDGCHVLFVARTMRSLDIAVTGPIVGKWDRSRLDQVVTNLLSNALKFGEGKPIEIETAVDGERVRLVVRDHGRGIPPDRIHRIFEPYERAVPAASFGGLGLGLFIVRSLVEAHGGTVRAESELGNVHRRASPRGAARSPGLVRSGALRCTA